MDEAIHSFEVDVLLNPTVATLYNLAIAYEAAARYENARSALERLNRIGEIPASAQARIAALDERLAARARGAPDIAPAVDRLQIIEAARRQRERLRCGGDEHHP